MFGDTTAERSGQTDYPERKDPVKLPLSFNSGYMSNESKPQDHIPCIHYITDHIHIIDSIFFRIYQILKCKTQTSNYTHCEAFSGLSGKERCSSPHCHDSIAGHDQ